MSRPEQQREIAPSDEPGSSSTAEGSPKTWWDRNGALVIAGGALVGLILVLVLLK